VAAEEDFAGTFARLNHGGEEEVLRSPMGIRAHIAGADIVPDLYETPEWAINKLIAFLHEREWLSSTDTVWEACNGGGRISGALEKAGFNVIKTDLFFGEDKRDYLEWEPEQWDVMITNPPYQFKAPFMERALALKKKWLMLFPIEIFGTKSRNTMFRSNAFQFIIESHPMKFTKEGRDVAVSAAMVWVGCGWGTENEIHFLPYEKE